MNENPNPPSAASSPPTGAAATQTQGTAADGAAVVGNPVQVGGVDPSGNAETLEFDLLGNLRITPLLGTTVIGSSGNSPNAAAVATLPGAAGKTTWITGFQCTASGATIGADVVVTLTGLLSSNMSFIFTFPAGVLVAAQPLLITFPFPLPASAANTAIVLTLPAGGAGNTNATATAQGFQL